MQQLFWQSVNHKCSYPSIRSYCDLSDRLGASGIACLRWHDTLKPLQPLIPDLLMSTLLCPVSTWYFWGIALAGISAQLTLPLLTGATISTAAICATQLKFSASLWNWRQSCKNRWQFRFTINKSPSTLVVAGVALGYELLSKWNFGSLLFLCGILQRH